MLRAQKAEEERANYEAAMHDLRQRNLYFQQQEDQRLADIDRHRQQRLQEEQAQRTAQSRCDPDVQFCPALLVSSRFMMYLIRKVVFRCDPGMWFMHRMVLEQLLICSK